MHRMLLLLLIFSNALADTKTLAISYFDNTSGTKDYDPLSKGFADMLITDLSNVKSLKIVEREKLESLLKEIELADGKFIDPNTAQKLGKGLGAGYMLTGSFLIMGETMRIDARLVDVGTGEVTMAEAITGHKNTFFKLEKDLVDKLIFAFDLTLSRTESRKVKKIQTQSFESFSNYSSSINALDNKEYEKSMIFLEKATELDENFELAWDKIEKLEQVMNDLEIARESGLDAELTIVINSLRVEDKDVALSFTQLLSSIAADANFIISEIIDKPHLASDTIKVQKLSKAFKTFFYVFNLYDENSFKKASYAPNMYIEPNINFSYINMLVKFQYLKNDVKDKNGSILIKYKDIDNIIINRSTKMMKKYPIHAYFQVFKSMANAAVKRKKTKQ